MKIRILMITYNRPSYTELSLKTHCENTPETAKIVILDNASGEPTRAVVKKTRKSPSSRSNHFNVYSLDACINTLKHNVQILQEYSYNIND